MHPAGVRAGPHARRPGGYHPRDIEFTAAFDVSAHKVGLDLGEAIFAPPNNTIRFADVPRLGVRRLEGNDPRRAGQLPEGRGAQVHRQHRRHRGHPQGDQDRRGGVVPAGGLRDGHQVVRRAGAGGRLRAGQLHPGVHRVAAVLEQALRAAALPIIGDDIKSQVGATIVHRILTDLFRKRGVRLDRTYQLNFGGNTDFLNMLERERLVSKKVSKTQAVTSQLGNPMAARDVHVGPSDYVPWLEDRKFCHIRMEGTGFGNVPMSCEVKLEVWDSPNSAGVVIDAIRCAKLALDRGIGGALNGPSSYFMKSPPLQFTDDEARELVEAFIRGDAQPAGPAEPADEAPAAPPPHRKPPEPSHDRSRQVLERTEQQVALGPGARPRLVALCRHGAAGRGGGEGREPVAHARAGRHVAHRSHRSCRGWPRRGRCATWMRWRCTASRSTGTTGRSTSGRTSWPRSRP
jgi:myo-inositol-1-phosphate synthase